MRRFGAALFVALIMGLSAHPVNGQVVTESDLWQATDRAGALQRMIVAAEKICLQPDRQRATEQVSELEREFIDAVRPLIRATLAGVYGHDMLFWMEKVTQVQAMKKHPDVLRAVIEVQTYEGAHNPYGIDTIEYQLVPGPHLFAYRVEHRRHPEARTQK